MCSAVIAFSNVCMSAFRSASELLLLLAAIAEDGGFFVVRLERFVVESVSANEELPDTFLVVVLLRSIFGVFVFFGLERMEYLSCL